MRIAIGSDHAGFEYKQMLITVLRSRGHEVVDFGNSPGVERWIVERPQRLPITGLDGRGLLGHDGRHGAAGA